MNIQVKEASVTAVKDGVDLGEMTSVNSGSYYIIDHTTVYDAARGLGVGKKLVAAFVEHAREKGMKVLPLCPFAKAEFEKNSAYTDVLYDN
jgi:predicted GNAT family acetyltransferase